MPYQNRLYVPEMAKEESLEDQAVRAEVIRFLDGLVDPDGKFRGRKLAEKLGGISHSTLISAYRYGKSIGPKLERLVAHERFGDSVDALRVEAIRAWRAGEVPADVRRRVEYATTGDVVESKGAAIELLEKELRLKEQRIADLVDENDRLRARIAQVGKVSDTQSTVVARRSIKTAGSGERIASLAERKKGRHKPATELP